MIYMKKLNLISLAMLLLMLYGCSGGGIMDTYWRDDKTGEWLIGLTEDKLIYDCKVWGIASMDENDGAYSIRVNNGLDSTASEPSASMVSHSTAVSSVDGACPTTPRRTLAPRLPTTTTKRVTA